MQRASDGTIIDAGADRTTGQLYVVWADARLRTDGVNDAFFTTSTDGGLTWGPATRINPGKPDDYINHYNVTVAVGVDGIVRVAYRQRQEAAATAGFSPNIDTYFQQSTDHGATWSTPLRVNTVRTDVYYGAFSRNGIFEGDYSQIATGGPYSYIVRDEAYALTPDETRGLKVSADGLTLVLNDLAHLHQRTWVAVVGPAEAAAPAPSPSPTFAPLPKTSALPSPPTLTAAGLGLLAIGIVLLAVFRSRLPRS
jgi:hypothetical protein